MIELLLMLAVALFAYYWWDSKGVEERAVALARQACKQRQLQFLDFSVMKQSTRLARGQGGQPQWQRRFSFEFHVGGAFNADGSSERYAGELLLLGKTVKSLRFDPHPLPDETLEYVDGPGQCMRR